ncbi:MAG TPA: CHASE3 domain-containing protein, partial [Polyangiaceae bacterium]
MVVETSQDQKLLAQRLLVAVVAPIGLLLLVGLILAFQIVKLTDTAHWVDHTDEVMGRVSEIQNQVIDQETGIRGYLLSGDRAFLDPYERAQPLPMFAAVHGLVADNPPQQVRIDAARARYEAWFKVSEPIVSTLDPSPYRTSEALLERKRRMDAIRETLQSVLQIEQGLRVERAAAYAESNRLMTFLGIPLMLALAISLAFLSRRQLGAVSLTYRGLLEGERTARGLVETQNWIRTQHMLLSETVQGELSPDELGRRALAELCGQIGAVAGSFFVAEAGGFRRYANFGLSDESSDWFAPGEGLV